jgi:hypothetical protein
MIILLGFPKSGTTSFQKLFTMLGYTSYHQIKGDKFIALMIRENKKMNKPLLSDFLKTDVITQMDVCYDTSQSYWPQIVDYKQIYDENSDAIFILNKRNPQKLLESFKHWNNYNGRLFEYSPELINNKTDEGFIDFVNKHYENIETFFSKRPNAKFITFDIENDNIEKLKKHIDIKEIKEFPHANINRKKQNISKS